MNSSRFSRAMLALLMLFLLGPFVITCMAGFGDAPTMAFPPKAYSLRWTLAVLESHEFQRSFITSVEIALLSTLLALLLGVPVAYALSRLKPPGAELIRLAVTSPLLVPGMVVGLALLRHVVLRIDAPVFAGLLIGHLALSIPYAVRVTYGSLANLRMDIEDAAVTLGATRLRTFFMIVLPNIRGALIAAFFLAFITSFNQVPVSLFLTGPGISTLPIEMLGQVESTFDPSIAALSTVLVAFSMLLVFVAERVLGVSKYL
ncbi:MAG: ABC transporter permease [Acidovorax sp.]